MLKVMDKTQMGAFFRVTDYPPRSQQAFRVFIKHVETQGSVFAIDTTQNPLVDYVELTKRWEDFVSKVVKTSRDQIGMAVIGKRLNICDNEILALRQKVSFQATELQLLHNEIEIVRNEQKRFEEILCRRIGTPIEPKEKEEVSNLIVDRVDLINILQDAAVKIGWERVNISLDKENPLAIEIVIPRDIEDQVADTTFDFYTTVAESIDSDIFKEMVFDFQFESGDE